MADDIDDLLDDVDEYLDQDKPAGKREMKDRLSYSFSGYPNSGSTGGRGTYQKPNRRKSDVDAMIDDIMDDPPSKSVNETQPQVCHKSHKSLSKTSSVPASSGGQRKCFQTWLGGSSEDIGLSTAVIQKCCDSLRCTDCDFRISLFDNYQWHNTTDYLFLRNNMPDYDRLKSKLTHKKGFRAYACQCKWKSIRDRTPLESQRDIKWVCGRH